MNYKIAIVEDEYISAEYLETILDKHDYEVTYRCESGVKALSEIALYDIDILFLDINLKDKIDGIMVARKLHEKLPHIQIVFITAYNDINIIHEASKTLPSGYIIKPFGESDILIALSLSIDRLNEQTKALIQTTTTIQLTPTIYYDMEKKGVYENEDEIILGQKEYIALELFCKKIDTIVSNEEIMHTVWYDKPITESTLRDLIYRLRQKLSGIVLKNVSSSGYRLHSYK